MNQPITKEEAQNPFLHGTYFGFVPHRLDNDNLSKFYHFPLNILFMSLAIRDRKQVRAIAVYEPDFYTYKKEGDLSFMRYHNIYGGDCYVFITFDEKNKSYVGEKYVNGKSVGSAHGKDDWHRFFAHLTIIGLAKGESCKFEDFEEIPAENKQ